MSWREANLLVDEAIEAGMVTMLSLVLTIENVPGRLSKAVERFSKVLARMQKKTPLRGFCDRWDLCREETYTKKGNWHHHGNLILWLKQELDDEATVRLLEEVQRAWIEAGLAVDITVNAKFKMEPVPRHRWKHEIHYAIKCPTFERTDGTKGKNPADLLYDAYTTESSEARARFHEWELEHHPRPISHGGRPRKPLEPDWDLFIRRGGYDPETVFFDYHEDTTGYFDTIPPVTDKRCKTCMHPARSAIETALHDGVAFTRIAKMFSGVSRGSVTAHAGHLLARTAS